MKPYIGYLLEGFVQIQMGAFGQSINIDELAKYNADGSLTPCHKSLQSVFFSWERYKSLNP